MRAAHSWGSARGASLGTGHGQTSAARLIAAQRPATRWGIRAASEFGQQLQARPGEATDFFATLPSPLRTCGRPTIALDRDRRDP